MSFVEKALRKMQTAPAEKTAGGRIESSVISSPVRSQLVEANPPELAERALSSEQLQQLPLINIDRELLRSEGMLPPVSQEHLVQGQFRYIKRTIIRAAFDPAQQIPTNPPRVIMLTSALAGDGKTFTCLNLALSLAMEHDYTVTLVDGDVAKPHISKLLGALNRPGLLDAVRDPSLQISSIVTRTSVPNLYFVPAGKQTETATELMASQRMGDLMLQLADLGPNNLVVFDSSPMLLTSEARVLAGRVQQVLLVIKAGITPQHVVRESVDILGDIGARVGVILNNADTKGLTGYGYGYVYGKDAGETAR